MRKLLALLLTLCFLLPAAACAEAAVELTMPEALQAYDGSLWALTYQGVHRLGDAGWQRLLETTWSEEEYVSYSRLFVSAAGVHLLGQTTSADGSETRWVIDRAAFAADGSLSAPERLCTIAWDAGAGGWLNFYGFAVEEGSALILLYDDSTGAAWGCNSLYRVSLADGSSELLLTDYLCELQPWKDGLYLASYWNQMEAYQTDPITPPSIVSVNASTGEIKTLAAMPSASCGGLAYDPEGDYAYVCDSSALYRYDAAFAAPERTGYLLPSDSGRMGMAAAVCGGRYYISDWQSPSELTSCLIDPAALPSRTLRLTNAWAVSDLVRQFAAEHPEIAIEYTASTPYGAEEVRQHMQSADAADIYSMSPSDSHYAPLRDKGYLADLSASEALTSLVGRMYPHMVQDVLAEGKLYGLPVSLSASTPGYYAAALEKVGLTQADLPTSLEGMLDFIVRWHEEFYPDWEDMQLFEYAYDLRQQLFYQIFTMHLTASGDMLTLDTPEIRRLLTRLEEISPILDEIAPPPEQTSSGVVVSYIGSYSADSALFTDYADPLPTAYSSWDGAAKPWPLALTEGGDPVISATMTLLCLNPYSDNADVALQLLEYIAQRLPQAFLTAVLPDQSEPIELSYYQENIDSITQSLENYRAQLESAEESHRRQLEEVIDMLEAELVAVEADRWAFSAEDIAAYREIAPYIAVPSASIFTGESNEAATLLQRYLDRQISAEQFIREFDRVIRMMQLEDY